MHEKKYSPEEVECQKTLGAQRALCERKILSLMFNGFSVITLTKDQYDDVCMIEMECSLEKYTKMTHADTDKKYSTLTVKEKKYFHLMVALDSLLKNGLVKKEIWADYDHPVLNEPKDLAGSVSRTIAGSNSWLAHGLLTEKYVEKQFKIDYISDDPTTYTLESIVYKMTKTGYDVAIRFMEHDDQATRFEQQSEISTLAAEASSSSAKTAGKAIWAAAAIAIASFLNILVTLMVHFKCI